MTEIRAAIDAVDAKVVALLAERLSYIEQAAIIKQNRDTVRDPVRVEDVIAKVKAEAQRQDAPDVYIEAVYRFLVEWSIRHEFEKFDVK